MSDADAPGSIVHRDIGDPQGGDFADPQAGLEHELHHRVVARRQPVGGSAGGARTAWTSTSVRPTGWRSRTVRTGRTPCATSDVRVPVPRAHRHNRRSASSRRLIAAGRRPRRPCAADRRSGHAQRDPRRRRARHGPYGAGEEMTKIVAIAAHGRRREIVPLQTEQEGRHPFRLTGGIFGHCMYCTQSHPPR